MEKDTDLNEASIKAILFSNDSNQPIPEEKYLLLSIDIRREVNRIPKAVLSLLKTDKHEESLNTYFSPGRRIKINLDYKQDSGEQYGDTVFEGVVVSNSLSMKLRQIKFIVELKDVAVSLTRPRKNAVFSQQSDDDIFSKIIQKAEVSGLTHTRLEDNCVEHKQVVQHYCTDWDFMVSRAEAQGRLLVVNDGELSARKVSLQAADLIEMHKLVIGKNIIYDLEFSVNAGQQYPTVESFAWNADGQKIIEPKKAKQFELKQGNQTADTNEQFGDDIGFQGAQLSSFAPLDPDELQEWADGYLMRSRLSLIKGRMQVVGQSIYKLLDLVQIDKLDDRYNGVAVITGICHRVDIDGWKTDLQLGLSARSFSQEQDILDAPAAGLLPGVNGLHIGVVGKFTNSDESKKSFQVKVKLPGLKSSDEECSVWARLATPDAGENRGCFFYPQPGDEVVVGFFNDDPRQPVILGSLFSKNKPPLPRGDTIFSSGGSISSRNGATIGFIDHEEKGDVYIETRHGGSIKISDEDEKLEISDHHKNEITMSKDGITLTTPKNLNLNATGDVTIEGKNVTIKGGKVDIK